MNSVVSTLWSCCYINDIISLICQLIVMTVTTPCVKTDTQSTLKDIKKIHVAVVSPLLFLLLIMSNHTSSYISILQV